MTAKPSDPLSASTIRSDVSRPRAFRNTLPCLTILAHPTRARLGERSALKGLLVGAAVELSRVKPLFGPPGTEAAEPLADPHLSRTPVMLKAPLGGSTIEIDAGGGSVRIDGETVQKRTLERNALRDGVVIELADCIVLLLHECSNRPLSPLPGLLGQSDAIDDVRRELLHVADLDTPVLLRGETGTGKERAAHAIHQKSARAAQEFVALNMAALPEAMAVSMLFGHARGAFTGASQRHRGLFERASGGTLLLDELGETPGPVQPMLLRAVETQTILPLGEEGERKVDVRFIAATDSDLEHELRSRAFSGALLHRLSGYEITLPPLRARREDVAFLLVRFIEDELAAIHESDRIDALLGLLVSSGFLSRLVRHPLPGNVRQLRNIARHLVISNRGQRELSITAAVERQLKGDEIMPDPEPPREAASASASSAAPARSVELSDEQILEGLRAAGWSPTRAAAALGLPTATLHDWMRRSSLVRRAADLSDDELRSALAEHKGDTRTMAEAMCVSERGLRITLRQRGILSDD